MSVNGKTVTDFNRTVDPLVDTVSVDGKPLDIRPFVYVAMYKPRGLVTTCKDEKGRRSVIDLLPSRLRHLRPVGRLDLNSEGLLIFTNDGDLTQRVTHPAHHLPKRYLVTVKGQIKDAHLMVLARGMVLADGPTQPAMVALIERTPAASTFEMVIQEGRNRQIRRMCAQLGYQVSRLVRVAIGRLQLGEMKPGAWRYLTAHEIRQLGSD